ncbi:MAG TPA: hypothetical protein VFM54_03110 [Micromonosporaceae bacterium]|nr:hypothetical protein [Micromonosporaceae bacterium]
MTRRLAATAVPLLLATVGMALAAVPAPAWAADVFLEVNPSTVEAGQAVNLRASCDDNTKTARVESTAFTAPVTVEPRYGLLTATVVIPADRNAGDYSVRLTCTGGQTATTTLHVVIATRPTRGPATGFGGTAAGDGARLLVGGGLTAVAAGLALAMMAARRRRAGT